MKARDSSMTLDEFRRYYDSHRGIISSVTAYDAAGGGWADAAELFGRPGAYTLIVVRFKNNSFLRVNVKPSLQVRMGPGKYASPATWSALGVSLTYEEKELLGALGDKEMTVDEIIRAVERSSFAGKDALLAKLKRSAEKMGR